MEWRNKHPFKTMHRIVKASDLAPEGTDARLRQEQRMFGYITTGGKAVWRMLPAGDAGDGDQGGEG